MKGFGVIIIVVGALLLTMGLIFAYAFQQTTIFVKHLQEARLLELGDRVETYVRSFNSAVQTSLVQGIYNAGNWKGIILWSYGNDMLPDFYGIVQNRTTSYLEGFIRLYKCFSDSNDHNIVFPESVGEVKSSGGQNSPSSRGTREFAISYNNISFNSSIEGSEIVRQFPPHGSIPTYFDRIADVAKKIEYDSIDEDVHKIDFTSCSPEQIKSTVDKMLKGVLDGYVTTTFHAGFEVDGIATDLAKDCDLNYVQWFGPEYECAGSICRQKEGCCQGVFSDGVHTCLTATREECEAHGGDFRWLEDFECNWEDSWCRRETGEGEAEEGCCEGLFPDGVHTCLTATREECEAHGADFFWRGPNFECNWEDSWCRRKSEAEETGGCCQRPFADTCSMRSREACLCWVDFNISVDFFDAAHFYPVFDTASGSVGDYLGTYFLVQTGNDDVCTSVSQVCEQACKDSNYLGGGSCEPVDGCSGEDRVSIGQNACQLDNVCCCVDASLEELSRGCSQECGIRGYTDGGTCKPECTSGVENHIGGYGCPSDDVCCCAGINIVALSWECSQNCTDRIALQGSGVCRRGNCGGYEELIKNHNMGPNGCPPDYPGYSDYNSCCCSYVYSC